MKNSKVLYLIGGTVAILLMLTVFYTQSKAPTTTVPHRGPVVEAIYGLGTVKSSKVFEHKQGVISRLRKVFVTEGDRVVAGQKLMEFDSGPTLLAPFSGVVTLLPFHEGENIFPQISLIRLEDLSSRLVEVNLEQQAALRVRPSLPVKMSFESLRGEIYQGQVESVYPSNGQFIVRVKTADLPAQILPGMTVDVSIEVQKKDDALLIPASSVNTGFVTIIRNGKKQKIPITAGLSDGESIEVVSGDLTVTDLVILNRK